MKKYNLLKVMGILFLTVVVLTWIIPAGIYSSGAYTGDATAPLGLFDLVRSPLIAVSQLAIIGVFFLVLGGFYGVLNKTGAYPALVEGLAKKLKGHEKGTLFACILLFVILSSVTGSMYVLFTLVPFVGAVLLLLGYDKLTTLAATFGAILVGRIGSTYGTTVSNYLNSYLNLGAHEEILTKVILAIIITFLLMMTVKKASKVVTKGDDKKETKKEVVPLLDGKADKKKSAIPLVILAVLAIIGTLIMTFDWEGTLGITIFTDLYDKINSVEVLGYPLFKNIIGTMSSIGAWSYYDLSFFMLLLMIVISWIYSVKLDDMIDGFVSGAKKMIPVALYVLLANTIFAAMASTSTGLNIFATIENWLLSLTDGFNLATTSLISLLSGIFYNDFEYVAYYVALPITNIVTDSAMYPLVGLVLQTMNGLAMMFLPTSIALVAGLTYFDVSYKEWLKYIWKYLLEVLVVLAIIFVIIGIMI